MSVTSTSHLNNNTNNYTTNRRQLYMLPTKTGWLFSLMVFTLFLASIKFSHQPTFLVTFLLSAIAITSSLHTHKNINQLRLTTHNARPGFVDEYIFFPLSLHNPSNSPRHNIWVYCDDFKQCVSLPANKSVTVKIKLRATKRGRFKLPAIILTTHYPIGILFSWSRAFYSNSTAIIYPRPIDRLTQPSLTEIETEKNHAHQATSQVKQTGDQIASLKQYQAGDRLRDIHWPALAKSGRLVSKEYDSDSEQRLIFNWHHVQALTVEDKLSQLTHWLLDAEKYAIPYQLNIPGFSSTYNHGEAHLANCLESLALFSSE